MPGAGNPFTSFYFVTFDVFGQKPLLSELLDGAGNCLSSGQSAVGRRSVTCGASRRFRGVSRLSHWRTGVDLRAAVPALQPEA
jgi:hypothetical protein